MTRTAQAASVPPEEMRLLEKTPKNALRIPFFDAIFPDARFIFLWRDPRENLEQHHRGLGLGQLDDLYAIARDGRGRGQCCCHRAGAHLRGRPLEEIAAYQWDCTNRIVLEDLGALDPAALDVVRYSDLVSQPRETIERLCDFAGIEFDAALAQRASAPLPLSRYTHTAPPGREVAQQRGRRSCACCRSSKARGSDCRRLQAVKA